MCRLAAYLGPSISLATFLTDPEHGLVSQAWRPREMREATLNADGFGVGWFTDDGQPATYINTSPIWTDANLESLGRSLSGKHWLASVRSATRVTDISMANTQPFHDGRLLFAHNGYIKDFGDTLRLPIRHRLDAGIENAIHGTTDSEYLFALLRQFLAQGSDIVTALRQWIDALQEMAGRTRVLLSAILHTRDAMYAVRHALNGDCPTLYLLEGDDDWPGARLLASEPMTASGNWQAIDAHRLVILKEDAATEVITI